MALQRTKLPSFDELKVMAEERPEDLEQLRAKMTEELLEGVPEERRRRLKGLDFRISMERQRAKNPMQACIRISQMMMDSAMEMRDSILHGAPTQRKQCMADVVAFSRGRSQA